MSETHYSIGQFAKKTGLSVRTLHYYDEIGLLVPKKNPDSGHRIYTEDDIKKLHKITVFKYLGYRLDEIKHVIEAPSFDMNLTESLTLQQKKLECEKERIETALSSIRRTIALLEEEGEIDSDILIALIANMQTENDQREWVEQVMSKDTVDKVFNLSEQEKMEIEKKSLYIFKEIKRLYGRPAEDPEVKMFIEELMEFVLNILEIESIDQLTEMFHGIHVEKINEEDAQELEEYFQKLEEEFDKLAPSPLTREEEEWMDEVLSYYLDNRETEMDTNMEQNKEWRN